jgi:hypothetical protein
MAKYVPHTIIRSCSPMNSPIIKGKKEPIISNLTYNLNILQCDPLDRLMVRKFKWIEHPPQAHLR